MYNKPYYQGTVYEVKNLVTTEAGTSGVQVYVGSDFQAQTSFNISGPFFLYTNSQKPI